METLYEWNEYEARKFVYNFSVLERLKFTSPAVDFYWKNIYLLVFII